MNHSSEIKKQPWVLILLVSHIMFFITAVMLANNGLIIWWSIALFAIGILQSLLFAKPYNQVGAFALVAGWIYFYEESGFWLAEQTTSLIHLFGLIVGLILAISCRQQWRYARQSQQEYDHLQNLLMSGESGTGLVSREVAELRLTDELERAKAAAYPVGVLLLQMNRTPGRPISSKAWHQATQALTRRLVSHGHTYDLAFRHSEHTVGLVLSCRDWQTLRQDIFAICKDVRRIMVSTNVGHSRPIADFIRLGVGWSASSVDNTGMIVMSASQLLTMAEDVLHGRVTAVSSSHPFTNTAKTKTNLLFSDTRA